MGHKQYATLLCVPAPHIAVRCTGSVLYTAVRTEDYCQYCTEDFCKQCGLLNVSRERVMCPPARQRAKTVRSAADARPPGLGPPDPAMAMVHPKGGQRSELVLVLQY